MNKRSGSNEPMYQEQTQAILDALPSYIWFKDRENNILRVNKNVADALGVSVSDIEGTHSSKWYPENADKYFEDDLEVMESGQPKLDFEERLDSPDGMRWVSTSKLPMKNDQGEVIGILVVASDITDRKRQEQKLEDYRDRLEIALDASQIGIWRWYPQEDRLEWDDRMFEIYGVDPGEFSGRVEDWASKLFAEDSENAWANVEESVREGIPFETEFRIERYGEIRHIRAYALFEVDNSGEIVSMIGANYDVTEEKMTELNLKRSNKELERFAYAASHDLKEPIRTIGGFATLLNKNHRNCLDAQGQKFLDFMLDGCTKMQNLIDSLLAYSRVDRELTEDFIDVDMSKMVRKSCEYLIAKAAEVDADIQWEEDMPTVHTHEHLVFEVVLNLIQNAMKFRHPDRRCEIRVSWKDLGHIYQFDFSDNGLGVEEEYHDRIFDIFQRLHDRSMEGTGIGLALCKKIVTSFGGRIWVESKYGKGSVFSFTLPKGQVFHEDS